MKAVSGLVIVQAIALILLIIVLIIKTFSVIINNQILKKLNKTQLVFLIPFIFSFFFTGLIPLVIGTGSKKKYLFTHHMNMFLNMVLNQQKKLL